MSFPHARSLHSAFIHLFISFKYALFYTCWYILNMKKNMENCKICRIFVNDSKIVYQLWLEFAKKKRKERNSERFLPVLISIQHTVHETDELIRKYVCMCWRSIFWFSLSFWFWLAVSCSLVKIYIRKNRTSESSVLMAFDCKTEHFANAFPFIMVLVEEFIAPVGILIIPCFFRLSRLISHFHQS